VELRSLTHHNSSFSSRFGAVFCARQAILDRFGPKLNSILNIINTLAYWEFGSDSNRPLHESR
jgi:hypothetical protein